MDNWAKSAVTHGCLRNHKRVHYPSKFQLELTDGIHGLVGQDLILDHQSLRVYTLHRWAKSGQYMTAVLYGKPYGTFDYLVVVVL